MLSQSYQQVGDSFKRSVTWGRSQGEYGGSQSASATAGNWDPSTLPPPDGNGLNNNNGAEQEGYHTRVPSNAPSLQQLPFSMADLDIYSHDHKEDSEASSDELYDDYRADDFSFRRRDDANTGLNQSGGAASNIETTGGDDQSVVSYDSQDSELTGFIEPIIRDYRLSRILLRVNSCKYNAEIAASKGNVDASQLWHLLSISLGTMSISVPMEPDANGHLVSRGPQTSWRDSAIGLLLLQRVLTLCQQTGGIQTLSTMICVLGGPSHVAVLLAADHPYFSSCSLRSMSDRVVSNAEVRRIEVHFNGVLNAYCNVLHYWGRFIISTEVGNNFIRIDR